MRHEDMPPDAHHRHTRKRARMPREQTAQHGGFPPWSQGGPHTCLGAARGHARHNASTAHQQIMHRVIQRIYLGAQRQKGGIGSLGGRGLIVHAGPNLSGSNNPHIAARQAPFPHKRRLRRGDGAA